MFYIDFFEYTIRLGDVVVVMHYNVYIGSHWAYSGFVFIAR